MPTSTTSRCSRQLEFRHRCRGSRSGHVLPRDVPTTVYYNINRQRFHLSRAKHCLDEASHLSMITNAGRSCCAADGSGKHVMTERAMERLTTVLRPSKLPIESISLFNRDWPGHSIQAKTREAHNSCWMYIVFGLKTAGDRSRRVVLKPAVPIGSRKARGQSRSADRLGRCWSFGAR